MTPVSPPVPFDRGAMYFSRLFVDPKDADRVFLMNVYPQVSDDGGKTLRRLPIKYVHVDTHCLWIDPDKKLVLVYMVQHAGFVGDGGKARGAFERAALEMYGK